MLAGKNTTLANGAREVDCRVLWLGPRGRGPSAPSFSCYREAGREVRYLTARGMVRLKPAQRFPVQHCGYLVVAKERKGPVVRSSLFGVHSMSGNTWLVSLGISLYGAVEAWVCIH